MGERVKRKIDVFRAQDIRKIIAVVTYPHRGDTFKANRSPTVLQPANRRQSIPCVETLSHPLAQFRALQCLET